VDDRVGQTFAVSVMRAVDRLAEEIAREALADRYFRRSIRELVRRESQAFFARLMREGGDEGRRRVPTAPRRSGVSRARSR
jgi:hypothetical protein